MGSATLYGRCTTGADAPKMDVSWHDACSAVLFPPSIKKGGKPTGIDRPDYRYRRALRPLSGPPYKQCQTFDTKKPLPFEINTAWLFCACSTRAYGSALSAI